MTIIEKIIAKHSSKKTVAPGDIVDITIDTRVARDFGGANVVKNIEENHLTIDDETKTYFTFDLIPSGSDQKYANNQHQCRLFARKHGIKVYDVNAGIGTHLAIDNGIATPGSTLVSTDSHANILGAIGAFGQGMGDQDIAAAWANGSVWFKVPKSAKLIFTGTKPSNITAKDIVLNLLATFGASTLLGYSVEMYGEAIEKLSLSDRITISSMGTEMGAIIIMFPPNKEVLEYSNKNSLKDYDPIFADTNALYHFEKEINIEDFVPMVSLPGQPHNAVPIDQLNKTKIDSAFIGSCTNGRLEDLKAAADVLNGRKVAPGVILKIVPATDDIWKEALKCGYIKIFKDAGALVSNAGCGGCANGHVGQNGEKEITISSGNRNFPGKQGKGEVYLASPETVAASAVAGYITSKTNIPVTPDTFESPKSNSTKSQDIKIKATKKKKSNTVEGKVWLINEDNIDTDMIFHNRYLSITNTEEMGRYALDNLQGYEDFAQKAKKGDIIITQKNFGSGSSRQQAVDCFITLGINAILAESFGAIYERNAINAALPIMQYQDLKPLQLENGDTVNINFQTGMVTNISKATTMQATPFSEVQMDIFQKGGIFK